MLIVNAEILYVSNYWARRRNLHASIYTFHNENKILVLCMTFPKYGIQHFTQ